MTLQSEGSAAAKDELGRQIHSLAPWFHNLHLPSGHQTAPDHPLGDFPAFKWKQIGGTLPTDMRGMRVLDIGCNAGFYSVALVRRGAHVIGIDVDPHYLRQAAWVRERFELDAERLELRQMQVYDLARLNETFDVVLFLGVLYHLRYPLLALDIVATKVRDLLVLQTLMMPGEEAVAVPRDLSLAERQVMLDPGWPKLAFIEHELAADPTNWWAPNRACVEAMLRSTGLKPAGSPAHEILLARRVGAVQGSAELRAIFPKCQPLGLTERS